MLNVCPILHSVGPGCANNRFDVKVVQVLLNLTGKITPAIPEDGLFRESTKKAIETIQEDIEGNKKFTRPNTPDYYPVMYGKKASGIITPKICQNTLIKYAPKAYSIDNGVVLLGQTETIISAIALRYYCNTSPRKKKILVTSGYRTPEKQAAAMYYKIKHKDKTKYLNQSAYNEILATYNSCITNKNSEAETIAAIARVITAQVNQGKYISMHLYAKAFDVRSRDMSGANKYVFKKVVKGYVSKVIDEGTPPHLHLQY